MYKCVIIEDQPPAQRLLEKYCKDSGKIQVTGVYLDILSFRSNQKDPDIDILFLDIHLPILSGMEALRAGIFPNNYEIIITTAYPQHALESYDFNVVDYLLKPFSFDRFMQAVGKVTIKEKPDDVLVIKSGHEFIQVRTKDIHYITADGDYTELLFHDHRILALESLKDWSTKLNSDVFIRVHKSFIINTQHIKKCSRSRVTLSNGSVIPIGRVFKENLRTWIEK